MKLELKNIEKSFSAKKILKDVSFEVVSGRAMGFLGQNGAGKTTTIRALMDVFKPDSGQFLYGGNILDHKKIKIGYLPEERGMYQKVTAIDQLTYFGELKGMNSKEAKESGLNWLNRMNLGSFANKNIEILSKGNQQKVQIIQAVINDPDILVLDEPFSGLDPVNSMMLKEIIKEFIDKDRIVIFSSHQMSYVENICDDVTFIKNGEIVTSRNLDELKSEMGRNKYIFDSVNRETLNKELQNNPKIKEVVESKLGFIVKVDDSVDPNHVLSSLIENKINVTKFEFYKPTLEEIFIEINKEA